ncbi:MAG: hypothetical protein R6V28_13020, partial [Nitriliruptoraceae bacterium]
EPRGASLETAGAADLLGYVSARMQAGARPKSITRALSSIPTASLARARVGPAIARAKDAVGLLPPR